MSLQSVLSALQALSGQISDDTNAQFKEAAQQVFDASQEDVPYVSGELHDSGAIGDEEGVIDVHYDADYAEAVHNGHVTSAGTHVEGQPFLLPHFEEIAGQLLSKLQDQYKP